MKKCDRCEVLVDKAYGTTAEGEILCFPCCARKDEEELLESGNSRKVLLYYDFEERATILGTRTVAVIKNWPGTLKFYCFKFKKGKHNIGDERIDFWFKGPDDFVWYGVHYGKRNSIVHCKRTKKSLKKAL